MNYFKYKFRVNYDEVDDFVRDIEILSTDNFESFHNILYSSIGLTGNELASFSICDTKWNVKKEITLIEMGDDACHNEPDYGEEDDFSTKSNVPKFVMKDSLLKDFMLEPHQKLIYEYNFLQPKVFYIELLKTTKVDEDVENLPRCTYKSKELPKEAQHIDVPDPEIEPLDEDDSYLDEFPDTFDADDQYNFGSIDEYKEY